MKIKSKYMPILSSLIFLILIPYSMFMCWIFEKPLYEFFPIILMVFFSVVIIGYIHLLLDADFYK